MSDSKSQWDRIKKYGRKENKYLFDLFDHDFKKNGWKLIFTFAVTCSHHAWWFEYTVYTILYVPAHIVWLNRLCMSRRRYYDWTDARVIVVTLA